MNKEKLANFMLWSFAVIVIGSVALWGGNAKAFNLPETTARYQLPTDTSYETRLIKLEYTQFGQMAHQTYRGMPTIELADGSTQNLGDLYKPKNVDIEFLFSTKMKEGEWKENRLYRVNLLWGGSTGQESQKMYVQPSVKLGIHTIFQTSEMSILSFSAQTTIAGNLKERACTADYGIAGTHQVKCSMASSTMAPQDTLRYLTNRSPYNATQFMLNWQLFFN